MKYDGFDHKLEDPPVRWERTREITVKNPLDRPRRSEPVSIPLADISAAAPDFNPDFFRLKRKSTGLEPLDIPSQVHEIPGLTGSGRELCFQLDLGPREEAVIDLQYNTGGSALPDYTPRTQVFGTWYRDGSNSAWENEIIGYRYYFGKVDYFTKFFPHLNLHRLASDSYHNERLWGHKAFMVGPTCGLGGLMLVQGDDMTPCYGAPGERPYRYAYEAHGGGPVCAGTVVRAENDETGAFLSETSATLWHGRYENVNRATADPARLAAGTDIAPGIRKFDDEHVTLDTDGGWFLSWGWPVKEYGTQAVACVFDPAAFNGVAETDDGRFFRLRPGDDGCAVYLTAGMFFRGSAEQPEDMDAFTEHVRGLAECFGSPVTATVR